MGNKEIIGNWLTYCLEGLFTAVALPMCIPTIFLFIVTVVTFRFKQVFEMLGIVLICILVCALFFYIFWFRQLYLEDVNWYNFFIFIKHMVWCCVVIYGNVMITVLKIVTFWWAFLLFPALIHIPFLHFPILIYEDGELECLKRDKVYTE